MTRPRADKLNPQSYAARKRSNNPQVSITINADALRRLDELRGHLSRGIMIAMLVEFWDSKKKRTK